jgi:hypothetical protein
MPGMRRLRYRSLLRRPAARWMPGAFAGTHARAIPPDITFSAIAPGSFAILAAIRRASSRAVHTTLPIGGGPTFLDTPMSNMFSAHAAWRERPDCLSERLLSFCAIIRGSSKDKRPVVGPAVWQHQNRDALNERLTCPSISISWSSSSP